MSLTDEIYQELWDGMEKGLDWPQFMAKHSASKGPLYGAISRFFAEVGTKIAAQNEEKSRVQVELNQTRLTVESLDKQKKEAEGNIVSLAEKQKALNEQVTTLETKVTKKAELVKHLAELERLGFNVERLRELYDALSVMGAKHGLKSKEAVSKFFTDLKDYGAVLEADLRLKGLQIQIETRKLEAENWQAKEDALRRKHDDLKEAVAAVDTFRKRGIKVSQIITWHQVVSRLQTVEQLAQDLTQYGDLTRLLKAKKEETERYELKLKKAQNQVETLEKERSKIEGAIDSIKVAGIKELKAMTEETTKQIKIVASTEITEIQTFGRQVITGFSDYFSQLHNANKKAFETGQEFERTRQKLEKYEGVKAVLESHAVRSEQKNEHVSK
jgi:chromosome segregation ATPase